MYRMRLNACSQIKLLNLFRSDGFLELSLFCCSEIPNCLQAIYWLTQLLTRTYFWLEWATWETPSDRALLTSHQPCSSLQAPSSDPKALASRNGRDCEGTSSLTEWHCKFSLILHCLQTIWCTFSDPNGAFVAICSFVRKWAVNEWPGRIFEKYFWKIYFWKKL